MQAAPRPIKAILYDLDGTLVDNFHAIHQAIVFAQTTLGLPPSSYEKVRATVGGGIELTMTRLVGADWAGRAVPLFHQHLGEHLLEGLEPLPGAAWLLEQLHARGLRQAVLTNKSGVAARAVVAHLGWGPWLAAVLGTEDTPWRKPQPEFSRAALAKLGVAPEDAVLIGDSSFDLDSAGHAGLRGFAVATGSHTRAQLLAHQPPPEAVFANLSEFGVAVFHLTPGAGA